MIVKANDKLLVGIVGLGKSGTTLVCNIINSAEKRSMLL